MLTPKQLEAYETALRKAMEKNPNLLEPAHLAQEQAIQKKVLGRKVFAKLDAEELTQLKGIRNQIQGVEDESEAEFEAEFEAGSEVPKPARPIAMSPEALDAALGNIMRGDAPEIKAGSPQAAGEALEGEAQEEEEDEEQEQELEENQKLSYAQRARAKLGTAAGAIGGAFSGIRTAASGAAKKASSALPSMPSMPGKKKKAAQKGEEAQEGINVVMGSGKIEADADPAQALDIKAETPKDSVSEAGTPRGSVSQAQAQPGSARSSVSSAAGAAADDEEEFEEEIKFSARKRGKQAEKAPTKTLEESSAENFEAQQIKRAQRYFKEYIAELKKIPGGDLDANQFQFRISEIKRFNKIIELLSKKNKLQGQELTAINKLLDGMKVKEGAGQDQRLDDKALNDWLKNQIAQDVKKHSPDMDGTPFEAAGDRVAEHFLLSEPLDIAQGRPAFIPSQDKAKSKVGMEGVFSKIAGTPKKPLGSVDVMHKAVQKDIEKMYALYQKQLKEMIKASKSKHHKALLQNILDAMPKAHKQLNANEFFSQHNPQEFYGPQLYTYVFSKVMSQGHGLPEGEFSKGVDFTSAFRNQVREKWFFDSASPAHQKLLTKLSDYTKAIDKEIVKIEAKRDNQQKKESEDGYVDYAAQIEALDLRKKHAHGVYMGLVEFAGTDLSSNPAALNFLHHQHNKLKTDYENEEDDTLTEVLETVLKEHPYYDEIKALDAYIATLIAEHPELRDNEGPSMRSRMASVFKSQEGIDHGEKLQVASDALEMLLNPTTPVLEAGAPGEPNKKSEFRRFSTEEVEALIARNDDVSGGRKSRLDGVLHKMLAKAPEPKQDIDRIQALPNQPHAIESAPERSKPKKR